MKRREPTYYREYMDNGDELVSVYGDGWQQAYVITKAQSDYWKEQAKQPNGKEGTKSND